MERGHHMPALLHPYRIAIVGRQDLAPGTNTQDFRCADEDCLHLAGTCLNASDPAIDLAAIGVTLDVYIDQIEARLRGPGHRVG